MSKIKISLVDDHSLFRKGLRILIEGAEKYTIVSEASNGQEFVDKFGSHDLPDIVLMDIDMPVMDGFQTCFWLRENHPDVIVLALTMYRDEQAIIKMLKSGAKGYLLKDTSPEELKTTLDTVHEHGFYYSENVGKVLMKNLNTPIPTINEIELSFLKLACSEMTYKEIADQMNVSPRTVDNYRESLFDKLEIKSRVGLCMYAIKHGIYRV